VSDVAALGRAASAALLRELATTPKPGLVDREHCGSHGDLCYGRLYASALALEPTFSEIARTAAAATPSLALREELGEIGRRGERAMFRESLGSNTHRGALFAVGLLVAAAAMTSIDTDASSIAERAAALAHFPDRFEPRRYSHGAAVRRTFGIDGARGEAAAGFPHAVRVALPRLRGGAAACDALLAIMATCADSCVLHRGGMSGLVVARYGARKALALGGSSSVAGRAAVRALDDALVARNVSCGGSADLLAAAFFLQSVASP